MLGSGRQALWFWREAAQSLDRRDARASTDLWLQSNLGYPDYSLNTFHYQARGPCMSSVSPVCELSPCCPLPFRTYPSQCLVLSRCAAVLRILPAASLPVGTASCLQCGTGACVDGVRA